MLQGGVCICVEDFRRVSSVEVARLTAKSSNRRTEVRPEKEPDTSINRIEVTPEFSIDPAEDIH